ncbi:hypothetical protein BTW08_03430 [Salinicola sp. MH3R3-1]|nr:hypothetical protein BTW08_03430 [Salinicola sp. MH3R3-1]
MQFTPNGAPPNLIGGAENGCHRGGRQALESVIGTRRCSMNHQVWARSGEIKPMTNADDLEWAAGKACRPSWCPVAAPDGGPVGRASCRPTRLQVSMLPVPMRQADFLPTSC